MVGFPEREHPVSDSALATAGASRLPDAVGVNRARREDAVLLPEGRERRIRLLRWDWHESVVVIVVIVCVLLF